MFTSVVGRLIWKEYRVQRGLWILLLGLLLSVQIVLRLAFFSDSSSQSSMGASSDELWATWAMWFVAFAAHVGFLVASIAIAFAGEREEQTLDRLIQLSPPPWAVLLSKMGTCLVGSVSLYLCGAVVALLLGRSSPNDPYAGYQLFFVHQAIGLDLAARVVIVFGLLVWCMFGSLLSQRVLTSIPAMAAGWVVTGWIPMGAVVASMAFLPNNLSVRVDQSIALSCFAIVAAGMAAIDIWLGYRWVEGKEFDFQFLADYREFWSRAWCAIADRPARTSRIPRGVESEDIERRPWQRLIWEERQRNWLVRWLAIGVCIFVLAANHVPIDSPIQSGVPSAPDLVVCLLALVMGVLSYRSDGEGHPVRFLANHGSSPGMIWKAKQAIWMARAFLTPAVLMVFVALRDSKLTSYPVSLIERHLWLTLLSFGCGQLAAMLLKRAMLAAITSATAAAVLFFWFELMRSLQMPHWWSLGIPVIAPLLATRLHARSWLLDSSTRQHKIRLSAVLIGFPLFVCTIVANYRVLEVTRIEKDWRRSPVIQSTHHWQFQQEVGNIPLVTTLPDPPPTRLQKGETPESSVSKELATRTRLLAIADTPLERRPSGSSSSGTPKLSWQGRHLADEVAGAFDKTPMVIHLPFDQPNHLFPVASFNKLGDLLLDRIHDDLLANEPKAALDACLAHLNLCQSMARGPFVPCWKAGADRERRALELLVDWANHRQVGFAEIHGAIDGLEEQLHDFPSPSSAIIDELHEAKRSSIVEQYAKHYGGAAVGWRRIWLQLPWEVSRREQLWDIESLLHRASLNYLVNHISNGPEAAARVSFGPSDGGDKSIDLFDDYLKPMAEIQRTTWGAEVALTLDRSEFVRDQFAAAKATLTRLGIIAYRKQYQKMPADLDAVIGIVRQSNFQDPWSSGRFDYRTSFLASQGTSQRAIDADSPSVDVAVNQPREASRFIFPIPPMLTDVPVEQPADPDKHKSR